MPRGPFTLAFTLGNIPVAIEPSFWVMSLLMGSRTGYQGMLLYTGVLLISLMVHELGHALMALAFGSRASIRLYSLGGLTYHERLGRVPSILTSLAGPFSGFLLGGIIILVERFLPLQEPQPRLEWLLMLFKWVNLGWGVVNLAPVLPLDGGHVLAKVLGEKREKLAVRLSTVFGGLIAATGFGLGTYGHVDETWVMIGIIFTFLTLRSAVALGQLNTPPPQSAQPGAPVVETEAQKLARGWESLSSGDDVEAERAAREVLTGAPEASGRNRALDLLAWVDLARGNAGGALRHLERVTPPENIRPLTQALALEAAGLLDRALPLALTAHGSEPSEATAQLAIRLLTHASRFDAAEEIAEAFKWPKPGLKESALGAVRHARGDFRVAAKLLQLAFELRRRPSDAFNAACSLARSGDPVTALAWLERAVQAGLDDPALLESDPDLEAVRQLPAFSALLQRSRTRMA